MAAAAAIPEIIERFHDAHFKAQQAAPPQPFPTVGTQEKETRKIEVAANLLVEALERMERALAAGDRALLSREEEAKASYYAGAFSGSQLASTWMEEMVAERRPRSMGSKEVADAALMATEAASAASKAGRLKMAVMFDVARAVLLEEEEGAKDAAAAAAAVVAAAEEKGGGLGTVFQPCWSMQYNDWRFDLRAACLSTRGLMYPFN